MTRAARYVRVSTEAQADNTSIPNQLDRCADYAAGRGWELVATFKEPGETGANLDRPALTAARRAAQRREYDVLLVYTLDRLTRNLDDLFLLRREFGALGIPVVAVKDAGLDLTTAELDALLSVLIGGYFGHRELETIKRRMREGMDRRIRSGKTPGGNVRYGWRRDGDGLAIHEEHAAVVRQVFAWCAAGQSTWQIAHRLDSLGVPSPNSHKPWHSTTVQKMLRAEAYYTGEWRYHWQGTEIVYHYPPIVSRELWDAAQKALDSRPGGRRAKRGDYLLHGLVRCGECGTSYVVLGARRPGGPHRYGCAARVAWKQRRRSAPCRGLPVSGPGLEEAVWSDVVEFVQQPHLVVAALGAQRDTETGERIARQLADTDRALCERRAELDRYLTLFGRGVIEAEIVEARVTETRRQIEALEVYRRQLVEEQRRADAWEREMLDVVGALETLRERLDRGVSFADKREIVSLLVAGIVVETRTGDDGEPVAVARVTYRFERPLSLAEVPIPAELVEPFAGVVSSALYCPQRQNGL